MDIQLSYIPQFSPIYGIIIDGITQLPLSGVKIMDILGNSTLTNLKGEFKFKTPIIENNNKPSYYPLTISKKGYTQTTEIPYNSINQVKNSLGIIKLIDLQTSVQLEVLQEQQPNQNEINSYLNPLKTPEYYFQEKISKINKDLKIKVLPLIYQLVAQYGISQLNILVEKYKGELTQSAQEELNSLITCPPQDELTRIINIKNKLVKQLNTSLTTIKNSTNLVNINDGIITGLKTTYNVLKVLPIPTAVAGVGIPISVINNIQDAKDILQKSISKLDSANTGISSNLNSLENLLTKIISYLNFLDKITQTCYPSSNQEQISTELTILTQQQTQQLSPIVINVNGFEMGVETEPTTNSLKRRRAIARNKRGVIMLTGEWSFSSIDQILIDELVFYIQQNDLKAD